MEASFVCGHITAAVPAASAQRSRLVTDLCQQAAEHGAAATNLSLPLPLGVSMPDVEAWLACSSGTGVRTNATDCDSDTLFRALKVRQNVPTYKFCLADDFCKPVHGPDDAV